MAGNINQRLERLATRRRGTDRLSLLAEDAKLAVLAKSFESERWQERARTHPYTRYALGAMQEVGETYTRISLDTAERVGRQLDVGLEKAGIPAVFRLQGSVPLNVHIRGVSDVDLLTIRTDFLTYSLAGSWSLQGHYKNPTQRTSLDVLIELRAEAERITRAAYPTAKVDMSGGKAIKLSGGSLQRPVDVVPSHWHDTVGYQLSGDEPDRGITILDKIVPETINNLPFLHIKRISERCSLTQGGLRKSIRLCKNVRADAEKDGTEIALPSFDIAATMYHAGLPALLSGAQYELAILAETQRHLDHLACNHEYAKTLTVPDGSRRIFDSDAKLRGLNQLSLEMDELARQVAKEQDWQLGLQDSPALDSSRRVLMTTAV